MSTFGHLRKAGNGGGPSEMFCLNLARYIVKLDSESPQNQDACIELRNLTFGHFVAAHRLIKTALKDDPVLSEFRSEFAELSTSDYLQIIGLMHAYGARKCYSDSPFTLSLLLEAIAASYDMPSSLTSSWGMEAEIRSSARLRADNIAQILGRPQDAARLVPSLHVVDRKIRLYSAFLMQEPELAVSELGSGEHAAVE
jgi:hypothetical protein